jgi:hypothetical protein
MNERDFRNRSFVALAIYLLTGDRQAGNALEFGEAVPETLCAFLKEMVNAGRTPGATPMPPDFLEKFEAHMLQPNPEGRGLAAIRAAGAAGADDLESVGSVSDFDEDWSSDQEGPSYLMDKSSRVALGMKPLPATEKKPSNDGTLGMILWAVGGMAMMIVAFMTLFGSPNQKVSSAEATDGGAKSATFETPPIPTPMKDTGGSSVASEPAPSPPAAPKGPEQIKKALLPSTQELEVLRKRQGNATIPISQDSAPDTQARSVAGASEPAD